MKNIFPYCFLPVLLLVSLQPAKVHAQDHYTDSLRQVMQTASRESDRLHAAVLLARELLPADPDSARALLESAAALELFGQTAQQADYFNTRGLYHWHARESEESISWYHKTLQIPHKEAILRQITAAANNIGTQYRRLGEPDSARVYLMMALENDQRLNNERGMAKSMYDLGTLHRSVDQHELAFYYLTGAIAIQKKTQDTVRLAYSKNALASVYLALNETEKATKTWETALNHAQLAGLTRMTVSIYNNLLAMWCVLDDGLDKCHEYFEKGMAGAHNINNINQQVSLLTNMGTAWFTAGEPEKAIQYYLEASEWLEQVFNLQAEAELFYRKGKAYRTMNAFEQAKTHLDRCLQVATRIQSPRYQSNVYFEFAAIDTLQANHQGFISNYLKGISLRDSIWNLENRSRIAELQIMHETEQKTLEIANLERQTRLIRFRHQVVTAGSVMIILLLLLLVLFINKRRTVNAQKLIIKEKEKSLVEAELRTNRRELTGIALSLAKSDQLNKKLGSDLQNLLDKTDEETAHKLKSALRLLKSKEKSQLLWEEFEKRFDELNEGFISRLIKRYPDLSPAEIRLCAMLRLQMSTKDIADMIKRSPRTIEHARNSARKKMNLKTGDNIIQLLLNI